MRVVHTEHSYNYKLRATLMTTEAISVAARLEQLRGRLSVEQTRALDLVVGIYNKEGRVSWQLPESLRQRLKTLTENQK